MHLVGTDAERLRQRIELPGSVGQYALVTLGGTIGAAGAALWITSPGPVAEGLTVLGATLIGLGGIQHVLLRRTRSHWPVEAHVWDDGVELILANGDIRAASWADPGFALDLYARPVRGSPTDEYLLVWKMPAGAGVPPCPLSPEGFERLRKAAFDHGLTCVEYRRGTRKREPRGFEIRPQPPISASRMGPATVNPRT